MVTLENGGIIKSIHGNLYTNSVWYCAYGAKGSMECGREAAKDGHIHKLYINADVFSGDYGGPGINECYEPKSDIVADIKGFGHGGSDFFSMYHFVEKVNGNENADIIDVYEAMDMFLPGMFAYRSILNGSVPTEIPNLRDKAVRDAWRNDTACTDPNVAGDMLLPTFSKGTPDIDDAVYAHMKELWEAECEKEDGNYRSRIFKQGSKK